MRRAARVFTAAFALMALSPLAPAMAQIPGQSTAYKAIDCDRACLMGHARAYMDALTHHDPKRAAFARDVMFTENDVALPIGTGLWGTISGRLVRRSGSGGPVHRPGGVVRPGAGARRPGLLRHAHPRGGRQDRGRGDGGASPSRPARPVWRRGQVQARRRLRRGPDPRPEAPARTPAGRGRQLFQHRGAQRRAGVRAVRRGVRAHRERHHHHQGRSRLDRHGGGHRPGLRGAVQARHLPHQQAGARAGAIP